MQQQQKNYPLEKHCKLVNIQYFVLVC